MAIDTIIDFACRPKAALGDGDVADGTENLLRMVKARNQARLTRDLLAEQGEDPDTYKITLMTVGPESRQQQRTVTVKELEAAAAPLTPLEPDCTGCPANALNRPFGCVGVVNYPIPAAAEAWLMDRVQPPDTPGGFLLASALKDFAYDGAVIRDYRAKGLFEAKTAVVKPFPATRFGRTEVSSDELLQAVIGVGPELDPSHVLMVLMWTGSVTIDGHVPRRPDEFQTLFELPVEDRRRRAAVNLGPTDRLADAGQFPTLLEAMFTAWSLEVPFLVDS